MAAVVASEVGMSTTNSEAVRRANAQILINQAALNNAVKLDAIYPIQRAVDGTALTGSVSWIGDSPLTSGLVLHGTGVEDLFVFSVSTTSIDLDNISVRSNIEDGVRHYRLFSTTGTNNTAGAVCATRCTFGNYCFFHADHAETGDGTRTPRGFTSFDMHDCTIRNLVKTMFVQVVGVPWEVVRLSNIRHIDCQMHSFYFAGDRPTLSGPVYVDNQIGINRRGPKAADNTGTYYCLVYAGNCTLMQVNRVSVDGYSSYRANSVCSAIFARAQQVIMRDVDVRNSVCVADMRNAWIDGKGGYSQSTEHELEGAGLESIRDIDGFRVVIEESYLESIIPDYVRANFWQSPWHMPDNLQRESNAWRMRNVYIRAPHLHSRYFWSAPGDLTVENLTLDCDLFTAQLTGGLFTLEAGPMMKQVNISNSRLIQRGETVTEYPLITWRTDPGENVRIIAYNNLLDGCSTTNNTLDPVPTAQPLVAIATQMHRIDVQGPWSPGMAAPSSGALYSPNGK